MRRRAHMPSDLLLLTLMICMYRHSPVGAGRVPPSCAEVAPGGPKEPDGGSHSVVSIFVVPGEGRRMSACREGATQRCGHAPRSCTPHELLLVVLMSGGVP